MLQLFWVPLTSTSSYINSINGATINQTASNFVAAIGDPSEAYIEYADDPGAYPNLIIASSAMAPFACMVDNVAVEAELLGGSHSPRRPK